MITVIVSSAKDSYSWYCNQDPINKLILFIFMLTIIGVIGVLY